MKPALLKTRYMKLFSVMRYPVSRYTLVALDVSSIKITLVNAGRIQLCNLAFHVRVCPNRNYSTLSIFTNLRSAMNDAFAAIFLEETLSQRDGNIVVSEYMYSEVHTEIAG